VKIKTGYQSHRGLVRENNEDNFLINPNINFFIVSDGLGGHQNGEIASRMAVDIISEFIEEKVTALEYPDLKKIFKDAYFNANTDILRKGYELQQHQLMGTTATSLFITGSHYLICHTGDSRAYLFRKGRITQLTKDQTKLQEMIDAQGKNDRAIPNSKFYGSIINYCLGFDEKLKVDFYEGKAQKNDFFLLCTDGLSDYVEEGEICRRIEEDDDPDVVCKNLVERALETGGYDNITLVLVKIC